MAGKKPKRKAKTKAEIDQENRELQEEVRKLYAEMERVEARQTAPPEQDENLSVLAESLKTKLQERNQEIERLCERNEALMRENGDLRKMLGGRKKSLEKTIFEKLAGEVKSIALTKPGRPRGERK